MAADQICDGSEGYLLGDMAALMVVLYDVLGRRGRNPNDEFVCDGDRIL